MRFFFGGFPLKTSFLCILRLLYGRCRNMFSTCSHGLGRYVLTQNITREINVPNGTHIEYNMTTGHPALYLLSNRFL